MTPTATAPVVSGPRWAQPPRPAAMPASPWLVGDVLGVVVANLVGAGLILGGLQGARHTTDSHSLLLLLDIAAAGVIVSLAGNVVFLLSCLRNVGLLRTELLGRRPAAATAVVQSAPAASADVSTLVAAPEMTRFHRPDCPAVQGKDVRALTLAEHVRAQRRPCGLCNPSTEAFA